MSACNLHIIFIHIVLIKTLLMFILTLMGMPLNRP